jgi:hypothetical protein
MTTVTAAKPRKTTSPRYPGWTIEQTGSSYLMTKPGGVFAIGVGHSDEHGWMGTLLTRQRGGWAPAKTPYVHGVAGCIAEADRREATIAKYKTKPLTK